jgi:circadian clock protein KaiB
MTPPGNASHAADPAARPEPPEETWQLRLYVTDRTPTCVRALGNLQRACTHWLPGRHHIEVIDLLDNPRRAVDDQIVAVPTLVKIHPPPTRKIVGDFSDTNSEYLLFGIHPRPGDRPIT